VTSPCPTTKVPSVGYVSSLADRIAVLEGEDSAELEPRVSALESGASALGDRATALETAAGALADRVTGTESAGVVLDDRATALEAQTGDLNDRATALESGSSVLQANQVSDEARLTSLESGASALGGRATALEAEDSALTDRATALEAQTSNLNDRATALESGSAVLQANQVLDEARLTSLESSTAAVNRPWEIMVTGGRNDAAVASAMANVLSGRIGNAVQKKLVFPPGEYHLSQPILTDPASNTAQLEGFTIEGQGKRTTKIYWEATGQPLINAIRRLRFFTISGMTVQSSNAGNSFVYALSDTSGYNEAWRMRDLEFSGPWLRVFGLDGGSTANLNSEFVLEDVYTSSNSVFSDAFFRCGGISGTYNQQNQFLNYWIKDCALTLASGNVFRFDKGGAIHVQNGSWSAASSTSGPITWFNMPVSNSNNRSACQLSVDGVRFEPKAANQKIITCAWGTGSVEFSNCCDLSSLQNTASYEYNLHQYTGQNPWGFGGTMPSVRYTNHQGAGYHQYDGAAVARGGVVYEGSYFYRGVNGDLANAVAGTSPALRWSSGAPRYTFRNCDNVVPVEAWS
jgi:hypothetical protein